MLAACQQFGRVAQQTGLQRARAKATISVQTAFARASMESRFNPRVVVATSLKIAYVSIVLAIAWSYYSTPQDAGFVRQEIAFLRLFLISFPASLFVDFWIIAPALGANYLLGGYLTHLTEGAVFKHGFVIALGAVNAVVGYRQWFIILPRAVSKMGKRKGVTDDQDGLGTSKES
jgi:hypothetical protein